MTEGEGEPCWGEWNCMGTHSWSSNTALGKIGQRTWGQIGVSSAEELQVQDLTGKAENGVDIFDHDSSVIWVQLEDFEINQVARVSKKENGEVVWDQIMRVISCYCEDERELLKINMIVFILWKDYSGCITEYILEGGRIRAELRIC